MASGENRKPIVGRPRIRFENNSDILPRRIKLRGYYRLAKLISLFSSPHRLVTLKLNPDFSLRFFSEILIGMVLSIDAFGTSQRLRPCHD